MVFCMARHTPTSHRPHAVQLALFVLLLLYNVFFEIISVRQALPFLQHTARLCRARL